MIGWIEVGLIFGVYCINIWMFWMAKIKLCGYTLFYITLFFILLLAKTIVDTLMLGYLDRFNEIYVQYYLQYYNYNIWNQELVYQYIQTS